MNRLNKIWRFLYIVVETSGFCDLFSSGLGAKLSNGKHWASRRKAPTTTSPHLWAWCCKRCVNSFQLDWPSFQPCQLNQNNFSLLQWDQRTMTSEHNSMKYCPCHHQTKCLLSPNYCQSHRYKDIRLPFQLRSSFSVCLQFWSFISSLSILWDVVSQMCHTWPDLPRKI